MPLLRYQPASTNIGVYSVHTSAPILVLSDWYFRGGTSKHFNFYDAPTVPLLKMDKMLGTFFLYQYIFETTVRYLQYNSFSNIGKSNRTHFYE